MNVNEMKGKVYDYASFSLTNGQSDYDVKANVAALFSNVPYAHHIAIFFNKEIGVRFNTVVQPKITMGISKSPFQSPSNFLEVKNIFLSNSSGETATIEILTW